MFRLAMELSYFGQQGLTQSADDFLSELGLGRAHYRVMFLLEKHPGLTTSDLLRLLEIRPQSLAKTMNDLIGKNLVEQKNDLMDRRRREHRLTGKGVGIEAEVFRIQTGRLDEAFASVEAGAPPGYLQMLYALASPATRSRLKDELHDAREALTRR